MKIKINSVRKSYFVREDYATDVKFNLASRSRFSTSKETVAFLRESDCQKTVVSLREDYAKETVGVLA